MSKKIKWTEGCRVNEESWGNGTLVSIDTTKAYPLLVDFDTGVYLTFTIEGSRYIGERPTLTTIAPAKKLTQHDYIALHLAKGESISNKNAYEFCGTMKLSTRIGEIEKAHNVAFKRTPEQHTLKCNGRKGNHTVYSLDGALSDQSTEFQNYIKRLQ